MKTLFIPSLWAELLLQLQNGAISFSFRHLPVSPPEPTNGYHLNACHLFSKDICNSPRSLEKPGPKRRHGIGMSFCCVGHNETVWGRAPLFHPWEKAQLGSLQGHACFSFCVVCVGADRPREKENRAMSQPALEVAQHYSGLIPMTRLTTHS